MMRSLERLVQVVAVAVTLAALAHPAAARGGSGALSPASPGPAADAAPQILRDVGIDQRLGESVPLDLAFRDETGSSVRLAEYFALGKPVVLSLVYYECPMLCTQVLNGLASALDVLTMDAGKEFTVITVSFNPRETPALAAEKKKSYLARYDREGAAEGWHFLTGDSLAIAALTKSVGFRYAWDAEINQYAHASGITVLTPEGKVARYFFGIEYSPRDLRLALVEASNGKIGTPVDDLLLYCYRYDPATGKYGAVVMNMVRVGGVATLATLGVFLAVSLRGDRRRAQAALAAATAGAGAGAGASSRALHDALPIDGASPPSERI
jgi:protein SCO1/2